MTPEANKATVRQWIEDVNDHGKVELIDVLAAPDYVYASALDAPVGREGYRTLVTRIRTAFPDIKNNIEEQIAEGDTVVTRGTATGTHRGAFMGIPATGKSVRVQWVVVSHLSGGRIARDFEIYDALGLLQQIGVVSALA